MFDGRFLVARSGLGCWAKFIGSVGLDFATGIVFVRAINATHF